MMKARSGPGFEDDPGFRLSQCVGGPGVGSAAHVGYPAFPDYLGHGSTAALGPLSAHAPIPASVPGHLLGSSFGQLNLPTMESINNSYSDVTLSQATQGQPAHPRSTEEQFAAEQFAAQANWELNYRNNLTINK